jgi:hypothetical protein
MKKDETDVIGVEASTGQAGTPEEAPKETPKGRSGILEMYRASNPETGEEVDDETLYEFARSRYADLEGRHRELSGANSRLAELVTKDPKLGALLSTVAGEDARSMPYAIGKIYGREPFEADDLDEFERGYQERLAEWEGTKANFEKYLSDLKAYASAEGLTEAQEDEVHGIIMAIQDDFLHGKIPAEFIAIVHKGLNYDKDVQDAADTGYVEGKNENVTAQLKRKTAAETPNPTAGSGSGKVKRASVRGLRDYDEYSSAKPIPGTEPAPRRLFG